MLEANILIYFKVHRVGGFGEEEVSKGARSLILEEREETQSSSHVTGWGWRRVEP